MAYFEEGSEAMIQLKSMVDRVGLQNVLYALAHICQAKAQHVSENWQDEYLSKAWAKQYRRMESAALNTPHD